jgi:hypothetical protein
MRNDLFLVDSRVRVTSYCPFRGLRGTIRRVNTIPIDLVDLEEPFCFYLISLDGAHIKEPIWFAYDEVELIAEVSELKAG